MTPRLPKLFASLVEAFLRGRKRHRFSIRSQLIFLVLVGAAPLLILSAVMFWRDLQLQRKSREQGMRDTVRAFSLAVDREVGMARAMLETLAASPYLDSRDFKSFYELSSRVADQHKGCWIVLFDRTGQQIINTRQRFGSALPNTLRDAVERPAAKRDGLSLGTASTVKQVLEAGKPIVTGLFMGIVSKRPTVSISVPVKRNGKVTYALSMGILPESFTALLQEHGLPGDWMAMLVDRNGIIIGHTADPERSVGRAASPELISKANEGWGTGRIREGVPVYFAFARSNLTGWGTILGAPQSSIDAPMNQSLRMLGAGAVLLVIAGLSTALVLGRRIARPLLRLASSAERIQQGEWIELDPLATREVKELHNALVNAAQAEREAANERQRQLVEQRMRHLAEVSAVLTESLGYENTLNRLGDLMVPEHADWCVIDLLEDGSDICRRVVVRTSRKEQEQFAQEVLRDYAPDLSRPHPTIIALQTGQTDFTFNPDASWLNAFARDERHRFLLEQMEPSGVIIVPLRVQERIAGTFSLVASRYSGRSYTIANVEFAEEVSRRASIALDKAWLYREVQKELAERKRSVSQLQAMYRFVERRHRAESVDEICDAALDAVLSALNCSRASISLLDNSGRMRFACWRGLSEDYRSAAEGHSPWQPDDSDPQPVCIPDVLLAGFDDSLKGVVTTEGIGALALIPLSENGRLIGKLVTYYSARHAFDNQEVEVSLTIARQIALGIQHKRAEEALRESEKRLAYALEATVGGIWDWNVQTGEVLYSRQWIESLGYAAEEVPRQVSFWEKIVHPDDWPRLCDALNAHLKGETPLYEFENRLRMKNGAYRWNLDRGKVVEWDRDGKPLRMVGTDTDINQRKTAQAKLHESEERFRKMADSSPIMIWLTDAAGHTSFVNRAYLRYFGITAAEATAFDWSSKIYPEDRETYVAAFHTALQKRQEFHQRARLQRFDGQWRWVESRGNSILDSAGAMVGFIASSPDITEIYESQQMLQELDQRKDEFIANMSHEIRSPLTGIMGYADLLLTRLTDPFDIQCIKTIKESGDYLIEIVNDILDLSKIEAGKLVLNIEAISVHAVLAEVQGLMDLRARQKKLPLFLRYDGVLPEGVQTDRTRLRQILVNLVSNAIKFTETGSVQIVARYLEDDGLLQIEVVDTGIGIAPEHQVRLFEPFTQADSTNTRQYGGTGLGLTITRRLVDMLGGSIAFESELSKGSTFRVNIPTAQQSSVPVDAASPVDPAPGALPLLDCHILIVDDRKEFCYLISRYIEDAGGRATAVSNGEAAIKAVEQENSDAFHAVILDIQMPGIDGLETTRRLRAKGFRTPIIALTAGAMLSDREKCLRAGCDDYLSKPIERRVLVKLVARYIQNQAI